LPSEKGRSDFKIGRVSRLDKMKFREHPEEGRSVSSPENLQHWEVARL